VEDTEIVDRLLPPLLEKWRKKRDKREAEKEKQRALAKKQKVSSRFCFSVQRCNSFVFPNPQ